MLIKQCEYCEARLGPFAHFLKRYNLKRYYSPDEPAIFFGMYSKLGLNVLSKHRSLAVVIWRGTDIISDKKRLESVINIMSQKKPMIKHVAISSFIKKDLDRVGITYKFIPIGATEVDNIDICPLGDEIYVYAPKTRYVFYGGDYIDKIKKQCKFKINIADSVNCFTKQELLDIYKKTFIGLRLTKHDGIANQVIEMGVMGRKCVHNGDHPNCIPWKNASTILESIEEESGYIGKIKKDVADKVIRYTDIGTDWLNTEYWK